MSAYKVERKNYDNLDEDNIFMGISNLLVLFYINNKYGMKNIRQIRIYMKYILDRLGG